MEHKKTKYLTILGVKYMNLNVNFSFIEIKQYHTCRNAIISLIKDYYLLLDFGAWLQILNFVPHHIPLPQMC